MQEFTIFECCFSPFKAHIEDTVYNEALEKILEAWLLVLQAKEVG